MPNTFYCNPKFYYHRTFDSLKDIVDAYIEDYKDNVEYEIKEIKASDFDEVFKKVGRGKFLNGVHLDHLRQLKTKALNDAFIELSRIRNKIKSCKNFHQIFELIEERIQIIYGIGEMYTYDVAFYLALNLGFLPKYIYLHKGTRNGARNMGYNVNRVYIAKVEFPKEFQILTTYDIENLLCIYQDFLKKYEKF